MAKGETYEQFIAKFNKEYIKTTDDCNTPKEIWEIVKEYVQVVYNIKEEDIIRPFYPGGNYKEEDYTNAVVVDNPPFSIIKEIITFYEERNIKYFLFADGRSFGNKLTPNNCVLLLNESVKYENGAIIKTCFITNLENDYAIRPCIAINNKVKEINDKTRRPKRQHEENVYSCAQFYKLCFDNNRSFKHKQLQRITHDKYGKLFGDGFKVIEE